MAHTKKGAELTENHRRAQLSITSSLVDVLKEIFLDLFDPARINESSKEFVKKALPLVIDARDISAVTASAYLNTFRKVELASLVDNTELPDDVLKVPRDVLDMFARKDLLDEDDVKEYARVAVDDLPAPDNLVAQMFSSSAAVAKKAIKEGKTPDEAKRRALQATQAKGIRLVADGGRAPLIKEVRDGSNGAVGYARVVDPNPCPFCAMLASRGAVYSADSFASSNSLFAGDGAVKVHDGCECTLEVIYGRRVKNLPPSSQKLAKEWADIASGQPDPWAAWRRYKQSGTLPGNEAPNARLGVDGNANASAPQYGRARRKALRSRTGRAGIGELDKDGLQSALRGLRIRRSNMENELAELENRGQSTSDPGPARELWLKLKRVNRQIEQGDKRLKTMD